MESSAQISDSEVELDEEIEEEDGQLWGDWEEGIGDGAGRLKCLFCSLDFASCIELFDHCQGSHCFDFNGMRRVLELDFYDCFKLINYVRSQVACNSCWKCQLKFDSHETLLNHEHSLDNAEASKSMWSSDEYLKPFVEDDPLLYGFGDIEDEEDHTAAPTYTPDLLIDLDIDTKLSLENGDIPSSSNDHASLLSPYNEATSSNDNQGKKVSSYLLKLSGKNAKKVNEDYFGSYSSFGIHREMLSDKVRMDAYTKAISGNPSLFNGATVMDLGCGTGILSLLAAQCGASRVLAVEASKKMAAVATQIASDNKFQSIEVVEGMIEELTSSLTLPPNSVDVLVSEWMGYCLLYESMLSSVLFARDKWLKPGGAILPDIATIYAAGFGKEATSLAFWEDVYGFDMSSVGRELIHDAAKLPIVDAVDSRHLVTGSEILKCFDLATMKPEEVDFTETVELTPNSATARCYGVVLWFDTSFSERFCGESPAVLSTSPYGATTHWSQTIFSFAEPISLAAGSACGDGSGLVGNDDCPAKRVLLRISIARAVQYRCIDVSVEVTAVSFDGRRRSLPAQIFNLT